MIPPYTTETDLLTETDIVGKSDSYADSEEWAETQAPHWMESFLSRLGRLRELEPNWDSYGARRIALQTLEATADIVTGLAEPDTPEPAVVPTPAGGVQLEWHLAHGEIEVEIVAPSRVGVAYEFYDDADEGSFTVTSDYTRLVALLRRLSVIR